MRTLTLIGLIKERVPERCEALRHQVCLLVRRSRENKLAKALRDHRCQLSQVHRLGGVLDVLGDQLANVTVGIPK